MSGDEKDTNLVIKKSRPIYGPMSNVALPSSRSLHSIGCPHKTMGYLSKYTVNSGNFVSFQTLMGFFLKKSFWYGRPFIFSVDVQNRGLGSGSL